MKGDLYLVVDSSSDYRFWGGHFKSHFPKACVFVDNLRSKEPSREFDRIVDTAVSEGFQYVVFLTDEDASPDPMIRVKRIREKIKRLAKEQACLSERIKVFGVRRCLEAWFLADEAAIRKVIPRCKYRRTAKTDGLHNPKREVSRLLGIAYGKPYPLNEIEFAGRMVCKVDFDRASNGSDSLSAFWKAMKPFFSTRR